MDEKQIQFLFDNYAKNKGFSDINEFRSLMNDEGSRKVFFDDSNKELGFKDFDDFEVTIGAKKKVEDTPNKFGLGNINYLLFIAVVKIDIYIMRPFCTDTFERSRIRILFDFFLL